MENGIKPLIEFKNISDNRYGVNFNEITFSKTWVVIKNQYKKQSLIKMTIYAMLDKYPLVDFTHRLISVEKYERLIIPLDKKRVRIKIKVRW